ncbi:MAG: 1-pyrroline-5-carboxylate dehydrogenase, partial [Bacteroidota bacterium]
MNGTFHIPQAINEPIYEYASGSNERKSLQAALKDARSKVEDIPMYIGSEEVRTGERKKISPPHDHGHVLGYFHRGDKSHVSQAINAA